MKKTLLFFMMSASLLYIGCSHPMRVTNLDQYYAPPSAPAKKEMIKLGVTSGSASDVQGSRYVNAVIDALKRNSAIEKVVYPYNAAVHEGVVDTVVDISVIPHYSGRGSNFLVNWPGFLIFAPAIWGYGYNADIETKANVTRLKDNLTQQVAVPTKWDFRQAEIDRTWTEIGWFEVGVIPLIGGIVFTQYDPDVTDEFIAKVSPNYGEFVARKIADTALSFP